MYDLLESINGLDIVLWWVFFFVGKAVERARSRSRSYGLRLDHLERERGRQR